MPARILDLFCEYLCLIKTVAVASLGEGDKLVNALAYFSLDTITVQEKRAMIDLILTGGPWLAAERLAILDYCQTDVVALERLLLPGRRGSTWRGHCSRAAMRPRCREHGARRHSSRRTDTWASSGPVGRH